MNFGTAVSILGLVLYALAAAQIVPLMWLGRLEFFALLALLQPHFWRR
ncbi:MAG: hypothetical protein GY944_04260 [bacterium]|nr:hypothetical protein [bacterium]